MRTNTGNRRTGKREKKTPPNTRPYQLSTFNYQLSFALILAVLALGWAFRYMVGQETPVGKVEGQILLADLHRPMAGVEILLQPTGPERDDRPMRRAVTKADGRFALVNVPTGDYDITATTRAHEAKDATVDVLEGKTDTIALNLAAQRGGTGNQAASARVRHKGTGRISPSAAMWTARRFCPSACQRPNLHLRVFKPRLSTILSDAAAADALDEVARGNRRHAEPAARSAASRAVPLRPDCCLQSRRYHQYGGSRGLFLPEDGPRQNRPAARDGPVPAGNHPC